MRKKRTYTRRQKALRWLTALIAVVLVLQFSGAICLLPSGVIAHSEQERTVGETEIFYSSWGKEYPMRTKRLYLSRNEDVILMSIAVPGLGWYELAPSIVMDPADPEMRHGAWTVVKNDTVWVCLAGFVPEGKASPSFTMGEAAYGDQRLDDIGYYHFLEEPLTVTTAADIPTEGGACFVDIYTFPRPADRHTATILVAENRDGYLSHTRIGWHTSLG